MSRSLVVLGLLLCTLSAAPARAWGPAAHRAVAAKAVDILPKQLKPFYKAHPLPVLAIDAETAPEGPDRRFPLDAVSRFPFAELPHTEAAFRAAHPDAGPGRLPWLVQAAHARLVEAFRRGDTAAIVAESDALAAVVADLSNPLALTENADGQKTGQHGLWVRFAERFPEALEKKLDLSPESADYLDRPDDHVFEIMVSSSVWLDNLLLAESITRQGASGYGDLYYDALARRVGGLLRERLSAAARDVASFWYTAWTEAGRPVLK